MSENIPNNQNRHTKNYNVLDLLNFIHEDTKTAWFQRQTFAR